MNDLKTFLSMLPFLKVLIKKSKDGWKPSFRVLGEFENKPLVVLARCCKDVILPCDKHIRAHNFHHFTGSNRSLDLIPSILLSRGAKYIDPIAHSLYKIWVAGRYGMCEEIAFKSYQQLAELTKDTAPVWKHPGAKTSIPVEAFDLG